MKNTLFISAVFTAFLSVTSASQSLEVEFYTESMTDSGIVVFKDDDSNDDTQELLLMYYSDEDSEDYGDDYGDESSGRNQDITIEFQSNDKVLFSECRTTIPISSMIQTVHLFGNFYDPQVSESTVNARYRREGSSEWTSSYVIVHRIPSTEGPLPPASVPDGFFRCSEFGVAEEVTSGEQSSTTVSPTEITSQTPTNGEQSSVTENQSETMSPTSTPGEQSSATVSPTEITTPTHDEKSSTTEYQSETVSPTPTDEEQSSMSTTLTETVSQTPTDEYSSLTVSPTETMSQTSSDEHSSETFSPTETLSQTSIVEESSLTVSLIETSSSTASNDGTATSSMVSETVPSYSATVTETSTSSTHFVSNVVSTSVTQQTPSSTMSITTSNSPTPTQYDRDDKNITFTVASVTVPLNVRQACSKVMEGLEKLLALLTGSTGNLLDDIKTKCLCDLQETSNTGVLTTTYQAAKDTLASEANKKLDDQSISYEAKSVAQKVMDTLKSNGNGNQTINDAVKKFFAGDSQTEKKTTSSASSSLCIVISSVASAVVLLFM